MQGADPGGKIYSAGGFPLVFAHDAQRGRKMCQKDRLSVDMAAIATAVVSVFVASCGGGSDGSGGAPSGSAATIDVAAVTKALPDVSAFVPICTKSVSVRSLAAKAMPAPIAKAFAARASLSGGPIPVTKALGSTKPADVLGDCGGRMGYPSYSHVSGVTTATLTYDNYCTTSGTTRQVMNGSISFVNTGTPSAYGPITTRVEAGSAAGVTIRTETSAGALISSEKFAFSGFDYRVGVAGGVPTAANPDTMSIAEMSITTSTGSTYRESGYQVTRFVTGSGGDQVTISGRGYRSNGDWFDVSTTSPWVSDASGNTVSGAFAFSGAAGNAAQMTMVPGATMQATMTVNGTAINSVPACK